MVLATKDVGHPPARDGGSRPVSVGGGFVLLIA